MRKKHYVVATMVDPRFRGRLFDSELLATATDWLLDAARAATSQHSADSAPAASPPAKLAKTTGRFACLGQMLTGSEDRATVSQLEDEIKAFLAQDNIPCDDGAQ